MGTTDCVSNPEKLCLFPFQTGTVNSFNPGPHQQFFPGSQPYYNDYFFLNLQWLAFIELLI